MSFWSGQVDNDIILFVKCCKLQIVQVKTIPATPVVFGTGSEKNFRSRKISHTMSGLCEYSFDMPPLTDANSVLLPKTTSRLQRATVVPISATQKAAAAVLSAAGTAKGCVAAPRALLHTC